MSNVNKSSKKCPKNTIPYIVKPGDSLFKIASRNRTTIEVLLELNPELNTNLLIPGIVMCIPVEVQAPPMPPNGMPICPDTELPDDEEDIMIPITPPNQRPMFPDTDNMPMQPTIPMTPPTIPMQPTTPMTPPTTPMQPMQPTTPMTPPTTPMQPPIQRPVTPGIGDVECKGNMKYTVKHGDTLYNISKRYDITLYELLNANKNINPYNLQIGQVICVPINEKKCMYGKVYTVVNGDTLATILTKFRISLASLKSANESFDPYNIKVGMQICIPPFMAYDECKTERTYIIVENDNLIKIAEKANVSTSDLLIFNPNLRPEDFSEVGIRICLPAEPMPYR